MKASLEALEIYPAMDHYAAKQQKILSNGPLHRLTIEAKVCFLGLEIEPPFHQLVESAIHRMHIEE